MARVSAQEFFASAARATADENSKAIDCSVFEEMSAILDVTVVAGTDPTMTCKFQVSNDGVIWADLGVGFTAATAATAEYKAITNFGKWLRVNSVIGGTETPTFTYSLVATGKMRA